MAQQRLECPGTTPDIHPARHNADTGSAGHATFKGKGDEPIATAHATESAVVVVRLDDAAPWKELGAYRKPFLSTHSLPARSGRGRVWAGVGGGGAARERRRPPACAGDLRVKQLVKTT